MLEQRNASRRDFVRAASAVGATLLLGGCATLKHTFGGKEESEAGVTPAEDLMREHGVLKRVLLIYGEALRRFDASQPMPAEPLADAAGIVRTFVEDYHEKLEEDELFPRFRKAGKLVDLVDVLTEQHKVGRRLTAATLKLANDEGVASLPERRVLASALRQFSRMYAPHMAREDTVLFPAIHEIVRPGEYDDLGDAFEKKEHELFGEGGFGAMVERVAAIEETLGIYDLKQFTPGG